MCLHISCLVDIEFCVKHLLLVSPQFLTDRDDSTSSANLLFLFSFCVAGMTALPPLIGNLKNVLRKLSFIYQVFTPKIFYCVIPPAAYQIIKYVHCN